MGGALLLIVLRILWRLHLIYTNGKSLKKIEEKNIAIQKRDIEKLKRIIIGDEIAIREIYLKISQGGLYDFKDIVKIENQYTIQLNNGNNGYFTLNQNSVDVVVVGNLLMVESGKNLYSPKIMP